MNQFDDIIYNIISSAGKTGGAANSALRSEALISAQTAIMQLEVIKSAIAEKGLPDEAGKLLLLCVELEKVNRSLLQIKREYSL